MHKNNIPLKVALGYCAVAIVIILAMSLVYGNTKSIIAINEASRDYIKKKDAADSTMSALLREEQKNLRQLSDAMAMKPGKNYLQDKVRSLNDGKDSIVVHSKAPQTHEAKQTTVEVMKTRRGFFRRLADAFKKEHAETLSVKQDSNRAVVDSVTTPVNVAENVADILEQIDKKEKHATQNHTENINKEMEDLRTISAQMALRSAKQLGDVHQQEQGSMQRAISKAMKARKQLLWQITLLTLVTLLAIALLVWLIWRDNKKERAYRETLEAANEEIQRIMAQRERLLLTITHDIKAPAASISGFIDLMQDYVSAPQGKECLGNIKNSAAHLSRLVASLLDYHQLENGRMEIHPAPFSPAQLVRESVEGMRPRAEEKGLRLSCSFDIEKGTDKKMFLSDAFRIRQILDNLVSNAVKYTDHGSVSVSARISAASARTSAVAGKPTLTLSVKDTGKGMTTEEKQKVFQAFTRLKGAQGIEGAGLGLSITQELASLLGGEIQLYSTPGKGSNFIVSIPLEYATEEEAQEREKGNFSNHKVLLLDDDKLQLQLLQEMLRRLVGDSWQVFACSHVVEALTILHNEQPALMLTDIEMPEMNGTEMIAHINHAQMTVVAMTAHDTSIKPQLLEAGFDDCLFKPFSIEKLAAILGVENQVQAQRAEKQEAESKGATKQEAESKGAAKQEEESESSKASLAPFLAFADGDEEAAREILHTVGQELAAHLSNLREAQQSAILPIDRIAQAAHKLLPIATMMQLGCIEPLHDLSPERIHQLGDGEARKRLQTVVASLSEEVSRF